MAPRAGEAIDGTAPGPLSLSPVWSMSGCGSMEEEEAREGIRIKSVTETTKLN